MEEKEIKISLKSQSIWILFAKVCGFVLSFLLPLIIVRYLTQDKVGIYRQSFQFITNAVGILPFGFSMAAYYFLPRQETNRNSIIFHILLFNFVVGGLACLVLFIYPQLVGSLFKSQEITQLAPKMGLVIWIWIFAAFFEVVAIANQETRIATTFIVLSQLSKTVLMSGAVILFGTVEAFIYAAIIQGVIQSFALFIYLKSRFASFWTAYNLSSLKEQFAYILPFGFASLLWTLQTDIHNYFVGYQFSDTEYAIYAYGCFQLPLISMLAESVASVLLPRMSELQAKNDTREMIRLTARAMQKLSLIYFPTYVFFMIAAGTFITTLFTKDYQASATIFMINLTLMPLQVLVTDPIVRAFPELGKKLLYIRLLIAVLMVSALYLLIQHISLNGVITVVIIIALLEKIMAETMIIRRIGVNWSDLTLLKEVGKTAVVSLIAGILGFVVYQNGIEHFLNWGNKLATAIIPNSKQGVINFLAGSFALGIVFTVFSTIYVLGLYFGKLIEDDEKEFIVGKIRAIRKYVGYGSKCL